MVVVLVYNCCFLAINSHFQFSFWGILRVLSLLSVCVCLIGVFVFQYIRGARHIFREVVKRELNLSCFNITVINNYRIPAGLSVLEAEIVIVI